MERKLKPYRDPVDWLAQELAGRVRSGVFPAGGFLPSERDLARETGIGRRHVRLALAKIEAEGLVKRVHGRGTQALAPERQGKPARVGIVYSLSDSGTGEGPLILEGLAVRLNALGVAFDRIPTARWRPSVRASDMSHFTPTAEIHRLQHQYDGLVFDEMNQPDLVPQALEMAKRGYPLVVANLEGDVALAGTRLDHAAVARGAVELLASLGHRRIGYVGWNADYLFYRRTLAGFREGMEAAGRAPEDSLMRYINRGGCARRLPCRHVAV